MDRRVAEHVLDMVERPTRLKKARCTLVAKVMEVKVDGSVGDLRLGIELRGPLVVWAELLLPVPDWLVSG
jgi:hypothetical protein